MVLPEQILVTDGDSREVDALGVDDLHIHSFRVVPHIDEQMVLF